MELTESENNAAQKCESPMTNHVVALVEPISTELGAGAHEIYASTSTLRQIHAIASTLPHSAPRTKSILGHHSAVNI